MTLDIDSRKSEYAKRLVRAGYEDFLVLERDTADRVLTERRLEVVDAIRESPPESITALADRLDRDVAAVHRDLDVLVEFDVVDYETDGARKRPILKHRHVFVEPIV